MTTTAPSRNDTVFLRFLAIVLIINTHMEKFYPEPVFAIGADIGNSLFFMLSAYGLLLSEKRAPQSFNLYFSKRLLRIYPVVWTTTLFLILPIALFYYFTSTDVYQGMMHEYHLNRPLQFIGLFFYPHEWFLKALMFFYLIGFFFLKDYSNKKILLAWLFGGILYGILYLHLSDFSINMIYKNNFRIIFYAMVFLSGLYLASINDKVVYQGKSDLVVLFVILGLIFLHRYMMRMGMLGQFQFVQQLLTFPLLYYFLKMSRSPLVLNSIMNHRVLSPAITLIAAMTLELYIVHEVLRREIFHLFMPEFPMNIIYFLIAVLATSYVFNKGNNALIRRLRKPSQ